MAPNNYLLVFILEEKEVSLTVLNKGDITNTSNLCNGNKTIHYYSHNEPQKMKLDQDKTIPLT